IDEHPAFARDRLQDPHQRARLATAAAGHEGGEAVGEAGADVRQGARGNLVEAQARDVAGQIQCQRHAEGTRRWRSEPLGWGWRPDEGMDTAPSPAPPQLSWMFARLMMAPYFWLSAFIRAANSAGPLMNGSWPCDASSSWTSGSLRIFWISTD